jgi:hypothetical protein
MFEDAIIDSDCLHSFNRCKNSVMHFSQFLTNIVEIPNSMGMGHVPKILEKSLNDIVQLWLIARVFLGVSLFSK